MAENKKVYTIQINGVKESIDAVDSLNKTLNTLDTKIKELESKTVTVSSKGGSSSVLSEEAALQKEINNLKNEGTKLDAKIAATQSEVYQKVQATKDLYKEAVNDQKQLAAQERLTANAYSNTMAGMKQHLADLKAVINTTDLGDSDAIKKMTQEANELTNKLKEMEEAYGQFGRNVGNYQSAFDGLQKISVVVNGVTQEFNSLRQAQRALANAMGTLEVNGKKDTAMYKQMEKELEKVAKAQLRLNSAMNDAKASSKAMDDMLDMFESFTALQQVGGGFSTFFGIDDSVIEKQIAKLVALQNTLQGIEKIRQQMNTGEGIGGIMKSGSDAVDKFVMKLTGAQKRMGMLVMETRTATRVVQGLSVALKTIGGVAVAGGLMILLDALSALIEDFKKWRNGGYEAGSATDYLSKRVESLNEQFEKVKQQHLGKFLEGFMTQEEYAIDKTKTLVTELHILENTLLDILNNDYGKIFDFDTTKYLNKPTERLLTEFNTVAKELDKVENQLSGLDKWSHDWFGKFFARKGGEELTDLQKKFQELGQVIAHQFMGQIDTVSSRITTDISETGKVTDETKKEVEDLVKTLEQNPSAKSLFMQIDKFTDKGQYYIKTVEALKNKFLELGKSVSTSNVDVDPIKMAQLQVDAMKNGLAKQRKQIELNRKKELADAGNNEELKKAINAKYNREILNAEKAHSREMAAVYADLADLRIQLMREGWAKQKAELEHERDERIRQIVESEKLVGERSEAVRALYKKKMIEAERDWAYEVLKINQDLFNQIEEIEKQAFSREVSNSETSIANKQTEAKADIWRSTTLPFDDPNNIERRRKYYEEILKIDLEASKKQEKIRQENLDKQYDYDKKEEEERHNQVANAKTIALVMEEMAKVPDATDKDYAEIEAKLKDQLYKMRGDLVDAYNEGKLDFKTFVEYIEKEQDAHNANMNSLEKQYNVESKANTNQGLEDKKQLYNTYYTEVLATIRTKQDEVAREIQKTPIKDNDWGVVQISKAKKNYKKALEDYKSIGNDIKAQKAQLKKDLALNNITAEDFFMKNSELDAMEKSIEDRVEELDKKIDELPEDWWESINQWIQVVGRAANQILSSLSEIASNQYEAQIEEQEKYIEKYEELLEKQKEATQKYADEVNSIEDELKTARGDRRQQLIDNLNAQMAAERASLAQEKKIEKEREKAEEKKKKLEHDQAVAKKKMDLAQAYINAAMAVSMAAVNKWPIPAIPMMALAAAAGAAQIAAVASQNIPSYGDGGVIQGKSHAQGGVKVLGGRAEVEGGEFITNKVTTQNNVELLDFVNSKKKRLNLSDFIEFYGGGHIKKNIENVKTKFADGGIIPTLRSDIAINDRLLQSFEDYSNRPVTVSVVEINDKQEAVRNVQVLSGLES